MQEYPGEFTITDAIARMALERDLPTNLRGRIGTKIRKLYRQRTGQDARQVPVRKTNRDSSGNHYLTLYPDSFYQEVQLELLRELEVPKVEEIDLSAELPPGVRAFLAQRRAERRSRPSSEFWWPDLTKLVAAGAGA